MLTVQGEVKLIDFGLCLSIAEEPKRLFRGNLTFFFFFWAYKLNSS